LNAFILHNANAPIKNHFKPDVTDATQVIKRKSIKRY